MRQDARQWGWETNLDVEPGGERLAKGHFAPVDERRLQWARPGKKRWGEREGREKERASRERKREHSCQRYVKRTYFFERSCFNLWRSSSSASTSSASNSYSRTINLTRGERERLRSGGPGAEEKARERRGGAELPGQTHFFSRAALRKSSANFRKMVTVHRPYSGSSEMSLRWVQGRSRSKKKEGDVERTD